MSLSRENSIPAIRPNYAHRFRCIGPECEDTCCQGWNVLIDKNTYEKYQAIPDGPLRVLVEQRLERTGSANDLEYARVKLDENGACPFLAEDRLCAIQKEQGESYLSMTCSQYPRTARRFAGREEWTLTLSCPEAARLVLMDRQLIAPPSGPRYEKFGANVAGTTPSALLGQVRNFAVLLIQDRSYRLWQRIFLLNMFCKRMEGFAANRDWDRIPALLSEHAAIVSSGSLRTALDAIPAQSMLQLGVFMMLIEDHPSDGRNRRFAEYIDDFARGIGHRPGRATADLVQNYIEAQERYYRPWAARHAFMLENYLLNYVFARTFPFGKPGPEQGLHPYRESQLLCFQYGLIQGLLTGMAGYYKSSFSTDHAIKLIQSFVKAVEHNAGLLKRIEAVFAANGLNNTKGVALLLHDGVQHIAPSALSYC